MTCVFWSIKYIQVKNSIQNGLWKKAGENPSFDSEHFTDKKSFKSN